MSTHRYPASALVADYARAGAGFLASAAPLVLVPVATWIAMVLGTLALLFMLFGWRTFERQRTVVTVDGEGIAEAGLRRRRIGWEAATEVRLRYYSTRRDRTQGWMQIRVESRDGAIRVDSTIEDFPAIAAAASVAVRARALPVDEATRANFRALGVPVDDAPADERHAQPEG